MRWRPLSTQAPEAKARSIGFSIPRIASGIMWRPLFHDQHRPPLRFLRLACSWLKYSEPRLAIFFPSPAIETSVGSDCLLSQATPEVPETDDEGVR